MRKSEVRTTPCMGRVVSFGATVHTLDVIEALMPQCDKDNSLGVACIVSFGAKVEI